MPACACFSARTSCWWDPTPFTNTRHNSLHAHVARARSRKRRGETVVAPRGRPAVRHLRARGAGAVAAIGRYPNRKSADNAARAPTRVKAFFGNPEPPPPRCRKSRAAGLGRRSQHRGAAPPVAAPRAELRAARAPRLSGGFSLGQPASHVSSEIEVPGQQLKRAPQTCHLLNVFESCIFTPRALAALNKRLTAGPPAALTFTARRAARRHRLPVGVGALRG
eukprot:365040-Chlamydomonas_euryale.AAC.8